MLRCLALWAAAAVAETANDCLAEDAAADAANYMLEHKALKVDKKDLQMMETHMKKSRSSWFMVEQLVIQVIQPLKVNVYDYDYFFRQ